MTEQFFDNYFSKYRATKQRQIHAYIHKHVSTKVIHVTLTNKGFFSGISPDICTPKSPALIPPPNADLIWRKKLVMFLIKGTFGSYGKWHASRTGARSLKPHLWLPPLCILFLWVIVQYDPPQLTLLYNFAAIGYLMHYFH